MIHLGKLNMKYMTKYALIILVIFTLFSCSKQPNSNLSAKEKQFAKIVPAIMNESLIVAVESKKQQFLSNSEIPLLIVNKSSHSISLDMNAQIKLLMYTSEKWIEIRNALTYPNKYQQLSPQGIIPSDQLHIFVKPVLDGDDSDNPNAVVLLRIVVLGETMTGSSANREVVGAYTDVSLKNDVTKPTTVIIESTAETITFDGGSIRGIVTSADKVGEPLPNVIIQLETYPFFNESNQIKVIATTTTDKNGRYSFDQVDPGVYALHTKIPLMSGGACDATDWSKSINIEIGSVVTANLSLTCSYQ